VMHSPPVAVLTHPFAGMALYAIVVFYTHLTPFMDHMAHDSHLVLVEQLAYVLSGWLMLLPLIGEEPIKWQTPYLLRLALLVVAMVPDTFVGIILLQTQRDPFPAYMAMRPAWASAPLDDLDIGGSLMWSVGDGLMMCLCVGLVVSLMTGRTRDRVLGGWLESVRTSTMVEHVERTGGQMTGERGPTIDDDENALDAYNAMLRRLGGGDRS
jgi:putative membrane protein